MSLTSYFIVASLLISTEWLYIRLARLYGWFDLPNERSSHTDVTTVRAGGIVFYLAVMSACWISKLDLLYFALGLTAIAVVSLWDDLASVAKRYRLAVHILAVGLLMIQKELVYHQWYVVAGLLLVGVGIVNAYNFMDGINGMTALYSLVTISTLWFCQTQALPEIDPLLPCVCVSLLIFSFTNVRQRAICFAGDVGSVSMGFVVLYGLLEVIHRSHTYLPVLFLAIYGIDSIGTIVYRLYLRQSIFQAHQIHLFQGLVHQLGWPHLRVAFFYALTQASINVLVIKAMDWPTTSQFVLAGLMLGVLTVNYTWVRRHIDRAKKKVGFSKPTLHYE